MLSYVMDAKQPEPNTCAVQQAVLLKTLRCGSSTSLGLHSQSHRQECMRKDMNTASGKVAAGQLMYTRKHLPLDTSLMIDS